MSYSRLIDATKLNKFKYKNIFVTMRFNEFLKLVTMESEAYEMTVVSFT